MAAIRTVAIAGAGGTIGRAILPALIACDSFDEVRVLTRQRPGPHDFPPRVVVKEVDYDSPASLEAALRGVDGLVSALSFDAIHKQHSLVDAAAAAGVRRVIPSEYGNDTMSPKLATVPIYQPKIAVREHCERLAGLGEPRERGRFSWTVIMNASFLAADWTLDFLVDMARRRCDLKDGGDARFGATTYADVARAVVGVFLHPAETANRPVKISSIDTTQNELLAIARALSPHDAWEVTHSDTQDLEREGRARWAAGDHSFEAQALLINRAFLGEGCGYFPVKDNDLLGVQGIDREELTEMIREALRVRA